MIILGARQLGKTWLMKEFGQQQYEQVAYINFESSASLKSLFSDNFDSRRILTALQIKTGVTIIPETTLLIFDEIISCSDYRPESWMVNVPLYAIETLGLLAEDTPVA